MGETRELTRRIAAEDSPTLDESGDAAASPVANPPRVASAADDRLSQGDKVAHYEIREVLGQGGMGIVYEAMDLSLGRLVALKLLRKNDPDRQARLLREARTLASLDQPGVVRVFEVGEHRGQAYIAMQLVRGMDLARWLGEERSRRDILETFTRVAEILERCHRAGIVHRDVKPSNIAVDGSGKVVVMDFGLAHQRDEPRVPLTGEAEAVSSVLSSGKLTETGTVLGTPGYMAPEQRLGGAGDARSDQYAFMVSLFEALVGHRPSTAPKAKPPLIPRGADIPGWLQGVLVRGLARNPEDRWPSMHHVARELRRGMGRRKRTILTVGFLTLLGGAGAAASMWPKAASESGAAAIDPTATCVDAAAEGARIWGPDVQARLARALDDGTVTQIGEALTAYQARWEAGREGLCSARVAGELTGDQVSQRLGCFNERIAEVERVLSTLAADDHPLGPTALDLVHRLPTPTSCAPEESLPAGEERPAEACAGEKRVRFVYFVEAGEPYREAHRAALEGQARALQQYWYEQFGGTFQLSSPVVDVILGENPAKWYVETPDAKNQNPVFFRVGNMKNEVYRRLGVEDFDPNQRVVVFPAARIDGRIGADAGGAWLDGDDLSCIVDGGPTYPFNTRFPAHCLGHLAHMFGHLAGLKSETGPLEACMHRGFYNEDGQGPMCDFAKEHVEAVRADPENAGWFDAVPGDRCGTGARGHKAQVSPGR